MTVPSDITDLTQRAEALVEAVGRGDEAALAVLERHGVAPPLDLAGAQLAIAREEGFERWHDLVQSVGERMVVARDLHRWFGINLNNGTWDRLSEESVTATSPADEREELLYGAIASAYHWRQAGTPINRARGEHLIARAAIRIGRPDLGLGHAVRCLEIASAHPDEAQDWDLGFAHEAIARAHAALGDRRAALDHRAIVQEIIAGMTDAEDRAILEGELANGEWFGLGD